MVKMSISCETQKYNKPDFYSSPAHGTTYLSTQSADIYTDCELLLLLMQNLLACLISEKPKEGYTNPTKLIRKQYNFFHVIQRLRL